MAEWVLIIKRDTQRLKEMDDFVEEHFTTEGGDCYNNRLTRRQREDVGELMKRYTDTLLIADLGKPSDKFD